MGSLNFDISPRRFNPIWLFVGLLAGRGLGLVAGMNFGFWYFATTPSLIFWQITGAIFTSLTFSFVMTSYLPRQVKYAIAGFGIGAGVAIYGGEIWAIPSGGLRGLPAGLGISLEWIMMHTGFFSAIGGYIFGLVTERKLNQTPIQDSTNDGNENGTDERTVETVDA